MDLRSNVEYLQEIKQKLDHDKLHLAQTNEQLQIQVLMSLRLADIELVSLTE